MKGQRMITSTVTIGGQEWVISGSGKPNPVAPTPRITATVGGAKVDISCQYQQVTSVEHGAGCGWGVDGSPVCTCAPVPADTEALFDAAREVQRRCHEARAAAEDAAERARLSRPDPGDVYKPDLPAGCEGCASGLYGGVCTCC